MCELAARAIRGVAVCTAEAELADDPLVGKTARTLEHLVAKHPDHRFTLVVGADILPDTDKWYRWDRVRRSRAWSWSAARGTRRSPGAPTLPAVSSTEIRERLARGEDVSGLVPRSVREYVESRRRAVPVRARSEPPCFILLLLFSQKSAEAASASPGRGAAGDEPGRVHLKRRSSKAATTAIADRRRARERGARELGGDDRHQRERRGVHAVEERAARSPTRAAAARAGR